MAQLARFGVSMDAELLAAFDALITRKGYGSRSEAIRDMVRDSIVQSGWEDDAGPTVAALCLVYDHKARDLPRRLAALQHEHTGQIMATLHIHLDARNCLEVTVMRGKPGKLRRIGDQMIATRGVKHGRLVMTTAGKGLR